MLPALSLDRILYVDIVEGSFNTASFAMFSEGLLNQMNPFPQPNSVIVMDNCCINKCQDVLDMITSWCAPYNYKQHSYIAPICLLVECTTNSCPLIRLIITQSSSCSLLSRATSGIMATSCRLQHQFKMRWKCIGSFTTPCGLYLMNRLQPGLQSVVIRRKKKLKFVKIVL
jgi:hypothetical protein